MTSPPLTYEQVMANDDLRDAFQPIVHQYRQWMCAKGFHPYTNRPLSTTSTPPTTPPKSQKSESSSRSSWSSKKSKPTTSPTPSSNSYESRMSIIRAFLDEERQQFKPTSKLNNKQSNNFKLRKNDNKRYETCKQCRDRRQTLLW